MLWVKYTVSFMLKRYTDESETCILIWTFYKRTNTCGRRINIVNMGDKLKKIHEEANALE